MSLTGDIAMKEVKVLVACIAMPLRGDFAM
jgi:hypothetical protein